MSEPEIVFEPIKKVVVYEATQLSKEDLLISMGHGTPVGSFGRGLLWAGGIAFTYSVIPWNDRAIDEFFQGTIHVNSVVFANWGEYQPMVELTPKGGSVVPGVKIPIWDVSNQTVQAAMAKWLKERIKS